MENIGTDVIGVQVDSVSLVPVKFSESKGRIDFGRIGRILCEKLVIVSGKFEDEYNDSSLNHSFVALSIQNYKQKYSGNLFRVIKCKFSQYFSICKFYGILIIFSSGFVTQ